MMCYHCGSPIAFHSVEEKNNNKDIKCPSWIYTVEPNRRDQKNSLVSDRCHWVTRVHCWQALEYESSRMARIPCFNRSSIEETNGSDRWAIDIAYKVTFSSLMSEPCALCPSHSTGEDLFASDARRWRQSGRFHHLSLSLSNYGCERTCEHACVLRCSDKASHHPWMLSR